MKDNGCFNPATPNCNAAAKGEGTECFPSYKFSIWKSFDGCKDSDVEILVSPTDNGGVMFNVIEADANLRRDRRGVFFSVNR